MFMGVSTKAEREDRELASMPEAEMRRQKKGGGLPIFRTAREAA